MITDQITGAPDNGWTAMGVIGGAIATALIIVGYKVVGRWLTQHSEIHVGGSSDRGAISGNDFTGLTAGQGIAGSTTSGVFISENYAASA